MASEWRGAQLVWRTMRAPIRARSTHVGLGDTVGEDVGGERIERGA